VDITFSSATPEEYVDDYVDDAGVPFREFLVQPSPNPKLFGYSDGCSLFHSPPTLESTGSSQYAAGYIL